MSQDQRDEAQVARYEDLRSFANRCVWTIDLQIRRLGQLIDDRSPDFVLQPVSDAESLITASFRLLAAARMINRPSRPALQTAIETYEAALPNLQLARNVVAHLDEYLVGEGRDPTVRPGALSAHVMDPERFEYGGFEFRFADVISAAGQLFDAIRSNPPDAYSAAVASAAVPPAPGRPDTNPRKGASSIRKSHPA